MAFVRCLISASSLSEKAEVRGRVVGQSRKRCNGDCFVFDMKQGV